MGWRRTMPTGFGSARVRDGHPAGRPTRDSAPPSTSHALDAEGQSEREATAYQLGGTKVSKYGARQRTNCNCRKSNVKWVRLTANRLRDQMKTSASTAPSPTI